MTCGLAINPAIKLVHVSVVSAVTGRSAEEVVAMIEAGRWLRWSFDLSTGTGQIRCLRVWRGSLTAWSRKQPDIEDPALVLDDILEVQRPRLRCNELVTGWSVTRPHIHKLVEIGELEGVVTDHTRWLSRASVDAFLRRRLVGITELQHARPSNVSRAACPTSPLNSQLPTFQTAGMTGSRP